MPATATDQSDRVQDIVHCQAALTNIGCALIAVRRSVFAHKTDNLWISPPYLKPVVRAQQRMLNGTMGRVVRLCLNACQITDAGAIALACALRVS